MEPETATALDVYWTKVDALCQCIEGLAQNADDSKTIAKVFLIRSDVLKTQQECLDRLQKNILDEKSLQEHDKQILKAQERCQQMDRRLSVALALLKKLII